MVQRDTFSEFSIHVDEFFWENFIENVRIQNEKRFHKIEEFLNFRENSGCLPPIFEEFFFACGGLFWKESVDANY